MSAQTYTQRSLEHQRQELILGHMGLVRHILGRLKARLPSSVDLENLEAAGVLGLVEAANRFEPTRGYRFDTFAFPRIRGAILDELRRNCPLPQNLLEKIAIVRKVYRTLPPPVTVEALVTATGFTHDDVVECLSAVKLTRVGSWEDIAAANDIATVPQTDQPQHQAELSEQKSRLTEAIGRLGERERLAVTLYYLENLRLKEIGALLDLSESRVSRLLKSAMFELGEQMRDPDDPVPDMDVDEEEP
jgi:RNA polymerase sigma factor for flagellar operon FliA